MALQVDLEVVWAANGTANPVGDTKYGLGWVVEIPSFQEFNYVLQGLDTNILVLAERGMYSYQSNITYQSGARVVYGGFQYECLVSNIGILPDSSSAYWTLGTHYGIGAGVDSQGISVENVYANTTASTWSGNDFTIINNNPLVSYVSSQYSQNYLMGNVQGYMCVVDIDTTEVPDGRTLSLTSSLVHKIYHEGNKPVQADVSGTTPVNTFNGVTVGRNNNTWVAVVEADKKASSETIDAGVDNTEYITAINLKGSEYAAVKSSAAEVDIGTEDTKYLTAASMGGSDYIKKSEIVDFLYPVGVIFESGNSINPWNYLGVGVWAEIGQGRVTVGVDPNDPLFDQSTYEDSLKFGGRKDAINVGHDHFGMTGAEPDHIHDITEYINIGTGFTSYLWDDTGSGTRTLQTLPAGGHSHSIPWDGTSGTDQNLQPYIVVYRWQRTA